MLQNLLYLDRFDVAHDEEATFNRLYDHEVVPELRGAPGVLRVVRYQTKSRRDPRYLTAYEITNSNVIASREWTGAIEKTPWFNRLFRLVINRQDRMYARTGGNAKLAYATKYLLFVSIDIEAPKEDLINRLL